jgi:5-methylthioadenosine/S-adenosylhomocysteine deaminase
MIALPGFVDTHTHLWSTQMRGRFGDTPETIYFRIRNLLGDGYRADDVYHGTRLGAAESVAFGITTAVDFFHNSRGPDDGAMVGVDVADVIRGARQSIANIGQRTRR